jgi:hypothetical protein
VLPETQQPLKALALTRIFGEAGLFEAQAVDLRLQLLILVVNVNQIDVSEPDTANASTGSVQQPFRRGDEAHDPVTDQTNSLSVGRIRGRTPHLHCQGKDLHQQNSHQHQGVLITAEEGFHGTARDVP